MRQWRVGAEHRRGELGIQCETQPVYARTTRSALRIADRKLPRGDERTAAKIDW
jgi:hypothetical protein